MSAADDFRLPDDHPAVVELRTERLRAEAQLRDLRARLTTYAGPITTLVSGVALSLFIHDDPVGGAAADRYPNPSAADLLVVLGYVPEARKGLDNDERRLIEGARRRGATWQEIAEALGLNSRQAARQRYARRGGKPAELDKQIEAEEAPHDH